MPSKTDSTPPAPEHAPWRATIRKYQRSCLKRSSWQLVNTLGGLLLLWIAMIFVAKISLWLVLPLAVLTGGFLVRIFIIFHDCTHNSFFRSRRANTFWGTVTGVFCFTPYHHWKWEHSVHHAHSGDLDSRGMGDVWTMTVDEYLKASPFTKLRYRINRNPVFLFLIAPPLLFILLHRIPAKGASARAIRSVHFTTLAILLFGGAVAWTIGWAPYLVMQFTSMYVASVAGVWLFYIQHQFEGVTWERNEEWDFAEAAINGSSFYRLPKILQWFSGNIGFHHMHHLSPGIPNYHLEECHSENSFFQTAPTIGLRDSLKSFKYRLWDEKSRQLVGFEHLRKNSPPS